MVTDAGAVPHAAGATDVARQHVYATPADASARGASGQPQPDAAGARRARHPRDPRATGGPRDARGTRGPRGARGTAVSARTAAAAVCASRGAAPRPSAALPRALGLYAPPTFTRPP